MIALWIAVLTLSSFAQEPIRVAVTVDDFPTHGKPPQGSSYEEVTKTFLRALKKHDVKEAIAYINAGKLEKSPELKRVHDLWKAAGYSFGNHSYAHESLSATDAAGFEASIVRNEMELERLVGEWKTFRYPFLREGDTLEKRNRIRKFLKDRGYQIAQVTIDFEDWAWNQPYTRCADRKDAKAIAWLEESYLHNAIEQFKRTTQLSRTLFKREIAHILLLHIGAFDARMMDRLLSEYKKLGAKFISLQEALEDPVYRIDPEYVAPYGAEFPYQVLRQRGLKLEDVGLTRFTDYPEEKLTTICR
jgi:peptidoglycan/xylan/chitin deacetylase (PgdA/CDA1 family)